MTHREVMAGRGGGGEGGGGRRSHLQAGGKGEDPRVQRQRLLISALAKVAVALLLRGPRQTRGGGWWRMWRRISAVLATATVRATRMREGCAAARRARHLELRGARDLLRDGRRQRRAAFRRHDGCGIVHDCGGRRVDRGHRVLRAVLLDDGGRRRGQVCTTCAGDTIRSRAGDTIKSAPIWRSVPYSNIQKQVAPKREFRPDSNGVRTHATDGVHR